MLERRKYYEFTCVLNQWLKIEQRGDSIARFFENKDVNTVAIYGMSFLGERVIDDLMNSNITVLYGIDKRSDLILSSINIFSPRDELPEVDYIIVTPVIGDKEIIEALSKQTKSKIISIKEVVYNL